MNTISNTIEITPIKYSNIRVTVEVPEKLTRLKDGEAPNGRGVFRIMTPESGDERVVWDSGDLDQIEDAKRLFDELKNQGLTPYRVGLDGKASSEEMEEFDPFAEEVIFVPQMAVVGG